MPTKVEKKRISTKNQTRVNEIIAVVFFALAILTLLCLISYSPNDPSFNTASSQKTQNLIGVVGANFAEFLFNAIGLTSYFLPALLALVGWRFFRPTHRKASLGRFLGYILFIVSTSTLFTLAGFRRNVLGTFFDQILSGLLGKTGAVILLSAFLAAAILLITNLSFASFFGNFRLAWENFRVHFDEWRAKRRARREANATLDRLEKRDEARGEFPVEKTPTISTRETVSAVPAAEIVTNQAPEISEEVKIAPEIQKEAPDEAATFEETVPAETTDLVREDGEIPISPIRATGDLDDELLTAEEPEPERKMQDFSKYRLPPTDFLSAPKPRIELKKEEFYAIAKELEDKTKEFNVNGRVMHICQGPVVTTYEFKPDPGVKYSRVTGLSDDLCLALKAESIRIDRIPGKAFVGIEVPNRERETINIREVIESKKFKTSTSLLSIALGKSIDGLNYVTDLAMMPHLLIAGSTGAGKSVGVNTLVVSILYKAKPDEVKFIMIDPKRLELGLYADIPHLLHEIIVDPKRASNALKKMVSEMERRYKELAVFGVRSIDGYNSEVKRRNANEHFDDNGEPWRILPYIVIIIDELADLMMASGREVEESITRLAQMARAVGIHLVLATQRPSVDVITGLIKANFPARISFRVSTKVDSRTIIDANGAEQLLGKGDMLFLPPATSQIIRIHGAFVDEKEINRIVKHVKSQGKPEYDTTITKSDEELADSDDLPGKKDALYLDALRTVVSSKRASTSLLQRHLRIGYGRAAAILDAMVHDGYIGDMDGSTRARAILQKAYDDLQEAEEGREI
jgi:S-DNA-T family DNA segregation ATPase FtsK/SpoIIIE